METDFVFDDAVHRRTTVSFNSELDA